MPPRSSKAASKPGPSRSSNQDKSESRSSRQLKRNNTAAIVQRVLNETFGDMTDAEKDGVRVGGLTLRERLMRDKSSQRKGSDNKVVMGKKYYEEQRRDYAQGAMSRAALKVKNLDEVPDARLLSAVKLARQNVPQRGDLYDYLETGPAPKQSEMVGLARFFMELKPWVSDANLKMACAVVKYWLRVNADTTFHEEMEVVRPMIDKTLVAAWTSMKAANISMPVFWSTYQPLARLVLSVEAAEKLFECHGQWAAVGKELVLVTSSSNLGMSLFGFALYEHQVTVGSAMIDLEVEKLLRGDISKAQVDAVVAAAQKKLQDESGAERLNVERVVAIKYCGASLEVHVDTLRHEICLKVAALVKTAALSQTASLSQAGALQYLFCEKDLLPELAMFRHKIDPELLRSYNLARETANSMLPVADHSNGLYVKNLLDTKTEVLTQIDDSFVLESAWLGHMHEMGGQAAIEEKLLAALPQDVGQHDPKSTVARLQSIRSSPLFSYVAPPHQATFNVGMEMVKAVANDRLPSLGAVGKSVVLNHVLQRMSFYAYLEVSGEEEGSVTKLSGKAALSAKLAELQERKRTGSPVNPGGLKEFHTFNWLLDQAERDIHSGLVREAYDGAKPPTRGASSSNPKAAPGGHKRKAENDKKVANKKLEQEEGTLKLFK